MKNWIFGVLLLAAPAMSVAADKTADACAPDGDLKYVCGVPAPEDLLPLPGGKWIVTSGMALNSGLHLVNVKTKAAERWVPSPMGAASAPYQACTSPPVLDEFQAHGLSLRDRGQGRATLYVVNHGGKLPPNFYESRGGRETIEIFDVDMRGAKPALSWLGCVALPLGLVANSVTSAPDGAILLTVVLHPGMRPTDLKEGRATGAVYQWRPGDDGFTRVWGAELPADNGIELSPDGKTLYVVGHGALNVFTNSNPAKLLHHIPITAGSPDNVHWVDGRLLTAGTVFSTDKACGDFFKAVAGELGDACIPGYYAAAIDPATLKVTILATGPGSKRFAGVASSLVVGKTLWLGSFRGDRLAYRALP